MSDLLQQVLAQPGADAPRLAYAQACDAAGDPRGEFIRLQLEAMKYRRRGAKGRASEPAERAAALLDQHREAWSNGVTADPRFYRGFVEGVTMTPQQFLDTGAELFTRAPIRHLRITGHAGPSMAALARSPLLARLVTLTAHGLGLGDDELLALLASPHLGGLRMLDLGGNRITVRGLDALAAAGNLPQLAYVNLAGNSVPRHEEGYGVDAMSGTIVPDSIYLDDDARALEQRHGRRAWFHPVSELAFYPPSEGDF
jgi:uncharacterized protein (TIGR02996 family)